MAICTQTSKRRMEESTTYCSVHTGGCPSRVKQLTGNRVRISWSPHALQVGAGPTPGASLHAVFWPTWWAALPCLLHVCLTRSPRTHVLLTRLLNLSPFLHVLVANWSRLPSSLVIASLQVSGSQTGPHLLFSTLTGESFEHTNLITSPLP